jgi:mannose-6-phosphate isomerase-like protein (cupin superfamily)
MFRRQLVIGGIVELKFGESRIMPAFVRRAESYRAFKLRPEAENYFACLVDPAEPSRNAAEFAAMVEIYPHRGSVQSARGDAQELLFVLKGKAKALCGGETRLIEPGDTIVMSAGADRLIENVGPGKLYTFTVTASREPLARMARDGIEVTLDDEDLGVLRRLPLRR